MVDHLLLIFLSHIADIFEDFVSPVTAAQTLLHSCCKKRKDMLQKTMEFIMQVLNAPNADPRQKDGALHMVIISELSKFKHMSNIISLISNFYCTLVFSQVGTMADILLKKNFFKEQMDALIHQYVFREFQSPHGHLRARVSFPLSCRMQSFEGEICMRLLFVLGMLGSSLLQ